MTRTRLSRNAQILASNLVSKFEMDVRGYASDCAKDAGREFANEDDVRTGYNMALELTESASPKCDRHHPVRAEGAPDRTICGVCGVWLS